MIKAIPPSQRPDTRPRPRILAQNQPDELKEPFFRAYPYGLPKEYSMYRAGANEIPVKYIEDNLPLGFYTNPPDGANAIFSTGSGKRPFRHMYHILPRRKLHLWSKTEIQQNCNSIRKVHWQAMRGMTEPLCWDDLWQYFDAFDLYHQGAINLWNIINHLYAENNIIFNDVMKIWAVELGHWADQWLQVQDNADKLKNWDTTKGTVIQILDQQDWELLGNLNDAEIPMLSNALKCRRDHLLSPSSIESADPRDLLSSSRNEGGLENWMTGQTIRSRGGLQRHKPSEELNCKSFKPPCVVVDGKHYYDPQTRSKGAVEALKASVEAASSHVVVANGSKMSPPTYPQAERIAVKNDGDIGKSAANRQHTRPSSSDGSITMTPRSTGTSHAGSPRRMSDSTVRPRHSSSPKIGHGSAVPSVDFAAARDPASQFQSQTPPPASGQACKVIASSGSEQNPENSGRIDQPPLQHGAANDASSSPQRHKESLGTGNHSGLVFNNEERGPITHSSRGSGLEDKVKSPHRGKRADSYSSQHNSSPSSRAQYGGFHQGGKPFPKKWNAGFRRQDNLGAFPDSMPRDFSNPSMPRADSVANAAAGPICPNTAAGLDRNDYTQCNCYKCILRNRSIWVRVADRKNSPILDVRARVRYGVESRFGYVEDVSHVAGQKQTFTTLDFIVRFGAEDSVPQALSHGGGHIEEHGIKISMSAMFRSKWVLKPSAFQMGNRLMPQDSMYRVVKAPNLRRGDLPFLQDLTMARGGPVTQRAPSGGHFMYNNQPFRPSEPRSFGHDEPYLGKKTRFPMNDTGSSRGQQPFHVFNPRAQYHGPPVESTNYQNTASMPATIQQSHTTNLTQLASTVQLRPVTEVLGEVEGEVLSAASSRDGAAGKKTLKPRVSLPERPATTLAIATAQCQSLDVVDQAVSDASQAPPRVDKSPVRQSKKKRQAAQLRAGNSEGTGPKTAISAPTLVSSTATTASAQPPAMDKDTRRPSLFTEDEIKGRKQAWDRIAVPLISPRKPSLTAEDALLPTKPCHDRAKSLPVATLAQPANVGAVNEKGVISAKNEAQVPESLERDVKLGSDGGPSAGGDRALSEASPLSPKKGGKSGRKRKNKQDSLSKLPAKKDHKL